MRRIVLPLASVLLVALLVSGGAIAAEPYGTLDANTLGAGSNYGYHVGTEIGQTFVAKHSGQMSSVQLMLYDSEAWEPWGGLTVRLYSISDPFEVQESLSVQRILSAAQIPPSDLEQVTATPTMVTADLSGMVRAGHHYAITAESTTVSPWIWDAHHNGLDPSSDIYPDGMVLRGEDVGPSLYRHYETDTIFAVYVNRRPTVSDLAPVPGSTIQVRRPTIAATVKDPETDLRRSNISLFVDGKRIARTSFSYDASTDRLSYQPPTRLPLGEHAVEVVATDERDFAKTKRWSFTIG